MIVAASMAIAMLAFIPACQLASMANVAALYGTKPVFTATLGWLWLTEKIRPATLLAIVPMAAGTCVLVWETGIDSNFVGSALASP
ncbi:EamA family transporter [Mesorhizobium sp. M0184]|uniref:EamA family transporter n=1 Tax=Mesorhizobium sp. M0184 TaxID=2956906 RepID=UPI003338B38C